MTLRLAPLPAIDAGLIDHQGELRCRADLMIEMGGADLLELEHLVERAHEYCVIAERGRIALCADTKAKLWSGYEELKFKVNEWRKEQAQLIKDIEGGDA